MVLLRLRSARQGTQKRTEAVGLLGEDLYTRWIVGFVREAFLVRNRKSIVRLPAACAAAFDSFHFTVKGLPLWQFGTTRQAFNELTPVCWAPLRHTFFELTLQRTKCFRCPLVKGHSINCSKTSAWINAFAPHSQQCSVGFRNMWLLALLMQRCAWTSTTIWINKSNVGLFFPCPVCRPVLGLPTCSFFGVIWRRIYLAQHELHMKFKTQSRKALVRLVTTGRFRSAHNDWWLASCLKFDAATATVLETAWKDCATQYVHTLNIILQILQ